MGIREVLGVLLGAHRGSGGDGGVTRGVMVAPGGAGLGGDGTSCAGCGGRGGVTSCPGTEGGPGGVGTPGVLGAPRECQVRGGTGTPGVSPGVSPTHLRVSTRSLLSGSWGFLGRQKVPRSVRGGRGGTAPPPQKGTRGGTDSTRGGGDTQTHGGDEDRRTGGAGGPCGAVQRWGGVGGPGGSGGAWGGRGCHAGTQRPARPYLLANLKDRFLQRQTEEKGTLGREGAGTEPPPSPDPPRPPERGWGQQGSGEKQHPHPPSPALWGQVGRGDRGTGGDMGGVLSGTFRDRRGHGGTGGGPRGAGGDMGGTEGGEGQRSLEEHQGDTLRGQRNTEGVWGTRGHRGALVGDKQRGQRIPGAPRGHRGDTTVQGYRGQPRTHRGDTEGTPGTVTAQNTPGGHTRGHRSGGHRKQPGTHRGDPR